MRNSVVGIFKFFGVLSLLLILFSCGSSKTGKEEIKSLQFDNPLAEQRADPFVTKAEDGNYYFIATVPEYDRIEIRKSKTINGIKEAEPVIIWRKHDKEVMGNHIWAPELHRIDGKWYVYFAAGSAEEKWKIRMYALSNPSADPTKGEWKEEGQVVSKRDDFSLDATTFELDQVVNSKFSVHHLGISGNFSNYFVNYPWKLLLSFSHNEGRYGRYYTPNRDILAGLFNVRVLQSFVQLNVQLGVEVSNMAEPLYGLGINLRKEF